MYLMISTYLAPLDEVDAAREDHLAFIAGLEQRGLVVSAGRQDPAVGGVILLGVDSAAEAAELIAQDPYVLRGLAEYQATSWKPTRGALVGWKPPVV
ncbi:YciI family protein [Actinoplanes sp. NPDC051494]|uniref:YciI family protein n=1 Tax=Actinoplanes sp. NPDC051494 TaxID=3363907 RepID=UPI00379CFB76